MKHYIKTQQKFLIRILLKEKLFDIRFNDRDYQVGDFIEYLPLAKKLDDEYDAVYDDFSAPFLFIITYIQSGSGSSGGLLNSYVALGIQRINDN